MKARALLILAVLVVVAGVAYAGTFQQGVATRNYDRGLITIGAGGAFDAVVVVRNGGGKVIDRFTVHVPLSGAITDDDGNVLAVSVPAGLNNARTSFLSALDTALDNAAAAGRFAR